jgi:glycosyltransferase involved in cell wall biosynthesis
MEHQPLISFVIPSYNRAQQVCQLVGDLLREPRNDFEVVVVDDASTDETIHALSELLDPRFRLFRHEKNVGMVHNWNYCARIANGSWLCIFHHDDALAPGAITHLRAATVHMPDGGLICTPGLDRYPNGQIVKSPHHYPHGPLKLKAGFQAGKFLLTHPFYCSSMLVSKSVYNTIGFFDHNLPYSADEEFWLRIAASFPIFFVPEPIMIYQRHPGHEMFRTWWKEDFIERYQETQARGLSHFYFCSEEDKIALRKASRWRLYDSWLTLSWLALESGGRKQALQFLAEARKSSLKVYPSWREIGLRSLSFLPGRVQK